MVRKLAILAVLAAVIILASSTDASACGKRGHCGGGCHSSGHGCGSSCGSGCGYSGGYGCGYSGGYGCSSCGGYSGGYGGGCSTRYAGGYAGGMYVAEATNEATIVVTLPADARLAIDGEQTRSTSERRVFITPALENGKEFHYTLKAEVTRDGKTQSFVRQVKVVAGEETQVSIDLPPTTVAAK